MAEPDSATGREGEIDAMLDDFKATANLATRPHTTVMQHRSISCTTEIKLMADLKAKINETAETDGDVLLMNSPIPHPSSSSELADWRNKIRQAHDFVKFELNICGIILKTFNYAGQKVDQVIILVGDADAALEEITSIGDMTASLDIAAGQDPRTEGETRRSQTWEPELHAITQPVPPKRPSNYRPASVEDEPFVTVQDVGNILVSKPGSSEEPVKRIPIQEYIMPRKEEWIEQMQRQASIGMQIEREKSHGKRARASAFAEAESSSAYLNAFWRNGIRPPVRVGFRTQRDFEEHVKKTMANMHETEERLNREFNPDARGWSIAPRSQNYMEANRLYIE